MIGQGAFRRGPLYPALSVVLASSFVAAACSSSDPGDAQVSSGGGGGGMLASAGAAGAVSGGPAGPASLGGAGVSGASAGGVSAAGAGGSAAGSTAVTAGRGASGANGASAGVASGPPGGSTGLQGGAASGGSAGGGAGGMPAMGGQGGRTVPDPGTAGDGDFEVGPTYATQPELTDRGAPKGKSFEFSMTLADSKIFDGKDATLDPRKPVNATRSISVYVPASYRDGTVAPILIIQDGPGELNLVRFALDNLTIAEDPARRIPPFIAIAVQNGGNDAQGSERGLEYDTLSDRYARFIHLEVLPAVVADANIKAAYPNLKLTEDPRGRATLGCSSGGAAALTMGWFRPDLFSRIITYSGTFVDQQDSDAPEEAEYPLGAWEYHSSKSLIANSDKKDLRIFLNVNENDLRANDAESTYHNWVMANQRTAAALKSKGYHYRYVFGRGRGHCDAGVRSATLADALVWVWRGYPVEP